jgi:hypothetical protein
MISTEEFVATACPTIADAGPRFYFTPETLAVGSEHGLDGFRFYFLGRGGVLGDVDPDVVLCAFGYFKPEVLKHMWTTGREQASAGPRELAQAYLKCCQDFGRRHLSDVKELDTFCAAAEQVNTAADPTGLPLYAGIASLPLADDLPARAMQLITVLREYRGSAHLAAVVATDGIDPLAAHAIKRPDAWALFGYDEDERPTVTDEQRAALDAAEEVTARIVATAYGSLDGTSRTALLDGLAAIEAVLPPMVLPG